MKRYDMSYLGNLAEYLIYLFERSPCCLNQTEIIDNASDQYLYLPFTPALHSVHAVPTETLYFATCFIECKYIEVLDSLLKKVDFLEIKYK